MYRKRIQHFSKQPQETLWLNTLEGRTVFQTHKDRHRRKSENYPYTYGICKGRDKLCVLCITVSATFGGTQTREEIREIGTVGITITAASTSRFQRHLVMVPSSHIFREREKITTSLFNTAMQFFRKILRSFSARSLQPAYNLHCLTQTLWKIHPWVISGFWNMKLLLDCRSLKNGYISKH